MLWPTATKNSPCPICGKPDWCSFGDKRVLCRRVPSVKPCKTGGWYHDYEDGRKPIPEPYRPPQPSQTINFAAWMRNIAAQTHNFQVGVLAENLGVSELSLFSLGAQFSVTHKAWAFPMRDGWGEVVGVRLRSMDAHKWSVTGSKQGLFVPQMVTPEHRAYLPEGPTSTAAMLTMGLYAIGRPTCSSGDKELRVFIRKAGIREVVIVADNDDRWQETAGGELRKLQPGLDGAEKLAKSLGVRHVIWQPPVKDVRKFLNDGGTKQMIEDVVNSKIWR